MAQTRKRAKTANIDDKENEPRTRKTTAKKPAVNRGKVQGRLSVLPTLPLDVLFEIFSHLFPLDILRLARVSKAFRAVLMSRSSKSVWMTAFENHPNSPEKPEDIPEPSWANLVFSPQCHLCLAPNIRNIEWIWRMRICSKCVKTQTFKYGDNNYNFEVEKLCVLRFHNAARLEVLKSEYEQVREAYEQIKEAEGLESSTMKEFKADRERFRKARDAETLLLEQWTTSQAEARTAEIKDMRSSRITDIVGRLNDLNFGQEMMFITTFPSEACAFASLKCLRQPQLITERIWSNIQGPIIAHLLEARTRMNEINSKVQEDLRLNKAVEILKHHHPHKRFLPQAYEFCRLPEIQQISYSTLTILLTKTFTIVTNAVQNWRNATDSKLLPLIRHAEGEWQGSLWQERTPNGEASTDDDDSLPPMSDEQALQRLGLAVTVFKCRRCDPCAAHQHDLSKEELARQEVFGTPKAHSDPQFYPSLLSHECLSRTRDHVYRLEPSFEVYSEHARVMAEDATKDLDYIDCGKRSERTFWNPESLCLDFGLGRMARSVVLAAGKDPWTTTSKEMDEQELCFQCQVPNCHMRAAFLGWRSAIRHNSRAHGSEVASWQIFRWPQLHRDSRYINTTPRRANLRYKCFHCYNTPAEEPLMSKAGVFLHLRREHDISSPDENRDYLVPFGVPPLRAVAQYIDQLAFQGTIIQVMSAM